MKYALKLVSGLAYVRVLHGDEDGPFVWPLILMDMLSGVIPKKVANDFLDYSQRLFLTVL